MSFSTYRYLLMTTDPVHIGTGGMRLGRVDNSIVREPGTRLPKIPGTSLSGAIRSYVAHRYGKRECAGQGVEKEGRKSHCGLPTCPICYTFGSVKDDNAFSGVVSIGDARLLLFPVYSMVGPVWVTSPSILRDFGIEDQSVDDNKAKWNGITNQNHLNLGWLMVEKDGEDWTVPEGLPDPARSRTVLISDKLFSQVVNSNLEVRTSVAINPETGAAEDGALFTYEAIPRATFLWMDVVVDDYRESFPDINRLNKWDKILISQDEKAKELLKKWHLIKDSSDNSQFLKAKEEARGWIADSLKHWNEGTIRDANLKLIGLIDSGLGWAEHLGIGGMGTRGFGRLKNIDHWQLNHMERHCQEERHAT